MTEKSEYVQYIVVRKDLMNQMGIGKAAAQVAHASLGVLLEKEYYEEENFYGTKTWEFFTISKDRNTQGWLRSKFTKLVVYVKTKEKMLNIARKLDNEGIRTKLIYDRCLTSLQPEEEDGTTLTCMGIALLNRNEVPKYLKKLQLLD